MSMTHTALTAAADALTQAAFNLESWRGHIPPRDAERYDLDGDIARATAAAAAARQAAADAGLTIRIKRELFRFDSKQQWINKGKSWYANCGVRSGFYLGVDAAGHVVHMGQCFMAAEERGLYPITVYELQTNWHARPAPDNKDG